MLTLFIYGLTPFVLNAYPSMTGVDLVITETHFTDSNSSVNSSNPIDTVQIDSVIDNIESPKKMESSFKSKVKYHANDSIMIDNKNNKAYLWGEAWVEYEDIKLDADYLEIDFAKNEVLAKGIADSTGEINNTPIFKEKGKEYKSGEMVYNFQTKKGLIKKITTQEANGYIHGQTIKMASQDVFYIKNGKYTTCSLDNPHYHIQAQKLKIINNDKIVTGPAYLVVENVPTFLAVPFGFFPNQDERTSGILIPAIGSSLTKGFNLTDGGYYLGISDQFDIKLLGDIYTNGSWSGRTIARYNSRYKRNGQLSVNYTVNNDGEKDTEDFTQRKSMFINWSHNQAPKAKPNSDFRAQVNIGSSDYFQNDLNTSSTNYIRNEFSSNITYSQRFGRSPFSASVNASHNQNNVDSTISFTLPELNVNMSRIYPFKRKIKIGKDKWYEKVGVNYTGNFKNKYKTKTNQLFDTPPTDAENPPTYYQPQLNNGVSHKINTSTSLKLGQFNLSPGVNYSETWYFKSVNQNWDSTALNNTGEQGAIVKDTTNGFYRYGNLNVNASISTRIYGIYAFRGANLKAIRHTLTPTVGVSYLPNLSTLHPDFFGNTQSDTLGTIKDYTVFDSDRGLYGAPNGLEQGNVTMGIQNIIEAKRKKRNDTTDAFTNVNIIDAWNFNTSYNMLADSFNWSLMNMNIRANVGKYLNLNANTISDFYGLKTDAETGTVSRSQQFNFSQTGQPLRLVQIRTSVGLNFSGNSEGNEKEKEEVGNLNEIQDGNAIYQEQQYVDFNIPWNMKVNYVFTYNKPFEEVVLVNSLAFSGSVNITPGWKVRMSSTYDFDLGRLGYSTIDVYRDLHCWQIDLSVIPFGDRKSFRINIKVKQGFLQDLKLSKNSRWFDG
ncbi:MAG: lipopolysaccharide assembly outer membrane protein LptD (OstA) [Salibacteraceae bacterium]